MGVETENPDDALDPTERVWVTMLARTVWRSAPMVRVAVAAGELNVDLVAADPVVRRHPDPALVVELDGDDERAHVVALRLRIADGGRATRLASNLLGHSVWAKAEALLSDGQGAHDFVLEPDEAATLAASWRGCADWLISHDEWADCVIGVEVRPGRVTGAIVDADATVLETAVARPIKNEPKDVVEAVRQVVAELAGRHPGTAVETCSVGVQLGGPVDTENRTVESYSKPLHPGDEPWKRVDLANEVEQVTGRSTWVFNDAAALAEYEIAAGRVPAGRFAVLIVGQGIGAKLVDDGRVMPYPMEIGAVMRRRTVSLEKRVAIDAIVREVARACPDRAIGDLAAAAAAVCEERAATVFRRMGRRLAEGLAPIQAVINPPVWVVYLPEELSVADAPATDHFMYGLRGLNGLLDYPGVGCNAMIPRTLDGRTGACVAAVAARRLLSAR